MKRLALIAAVIAVSACNSAAKEKARADSIAAVAAADSTARAAADKARADSIAAAAAAAKAKSTKGKTR